MIKEKMASVSHSRIVLEPALERATRHLTADELELAARIYYRWAKQLWVKVRVLRAAESPRRSHPAWPLPQDSRATRRQGGFRSQN